jgi:hypothetical protein
MNCKFCNRIINNKGSLKAHENVCKENPDKIKYGRSINSGLKQGNIPWNKHKFIGRHEKWDKLFPLESVLIENSTYPRHSLKKRILDNGLIEYKCDICHCDPIWRDKPMPLILDHINGINNDNRLNNLRFVCSNCDSQLDTYKSKNKK